MAPRRSLPSRACACFRIPRTRRPPEYHPKRHSIPGSHRAAPVPCEDRDARPHTEEPAISAHAAQQAIPHATPSRNERQNPDPAETRKARPRKSACATSPETRRSRASLPPNASKERQACLQTPESHVGPPQSGSRVEASPRPHASTRSTHPAGPEHDANPPRRSHRQYARPSNEPRSARSWDTTNRKRSSKNHAANPTPKRAHIPHLTSDI